MATRTWAKLFSSAAAVALSVGLASSAMAVPTAISYTGHLRTLAGPVDGQVDVSVTLYDAASGGNAVWGPQAWTDHSVSGGVLRLMIGGSSMPALDGVLQTYDNLWAEFTVGTDTLGGRQKLGAAPFAIVAQNADRLGGTDAADYVTNATFAAAAAAAAHGTAPANPTAGQLWFSTADQTMYAWDSGSMAWVGVSVGDAAPADLPPDGLKTLSSGMLTNTFNNVSHLNTTAKNIADAGIAGPGAPAIQAVTVSEASGSYITSITVLTNFNLTSGNDILMKLIPPAVMGAGEIVLSDGLLTFGPYGQTWTTATTPALATLLQQNPTGTWTLAVIDRDDNLANTGPNVSGSLNSFELRYNIVRSNHVAANGLLEVDTVVVNNPVTANNLEALDSDSEWLVDGDLKVGGEMVRKVQYFDLYGQETPVQVGGVNYFVAGRAVQFEKKHDDTSLRIHWQDNIYPGTTNDYYFEMRIDGKPCTVPGLTRFWNQWVHGSGWHFYTQNFIGYCTQLENETSPIPKGTHEFTIFCNRNEPTIGWNSETGFITIEEIY